MKSSGYPRLTAIVSLVASIVIAAPVARGQQCAGDVNGDGKVTVEDVLAVVNDALIGCTANVSADQACTDVSTANCARLDECVANGTTIRYGHLTVCRARQKQACLVRLGAANTVNSPAAVEQCAAAVPSASCDDFDQGDIVPCQAKMGTIANGGACTYSGQCASSNCAIVSGTNCGTCAPPNQAGDSCAQTSCSQGFVCVQDSMQCQPHAAAGNACDKDHPCSVGLSCVTPSGASEGTCQLAGETLGTTCDPKHQSAPGCDSTAGLYCDATTNTCLAVTYADAPDQCGNVGGVSVVCTNASTCFGASGQTPGTCAADASDGKPCDTAAGPSCVPPARCVTGGPTMTSGTCRLPDPTMCN